MAESLGGRSSLVIGGGSGLGQGLARVLAARGSDVMVTTTGDRTRTEVIAGVTDGLEPVHAGGRIGRVDAVRCDLRDEQTITDAIDHVGHLDHLAVIGAPHPTEANRREDFDARMWGAACAAFAARDRMGDDGSILFVSAATAHRPLRGAWMMTCVFSAVEGLTRALAVEFAPIRVNCIRGGIFDTPAWDALGEVHREEWLAWRTGSIPTGRPGTAAEFGEAAAGILTATYVTGAIVAVDGGRMLSDV